MKYRKKEIIDAVPYDDSMEDGFVVRYGIKDKEDGSIHTWGLPSGDPNEFEVKVPYVICKKSGRKVLAGNNYMMITEEDGSIFALLEEEFHEIYEPINKNGHGKSKK